MPITEVQAKAYILAAPLSPSDQIQIEAPDIQLSSLLSNLPPEHPIRLLLTTIRAFLNLDHFPAFTLKLTSTIPIASGLGSGAAISVAAARAVTTFLGASLAAQHISTIAFEVEKIHHGTPSGIDNAVIAYAQPVFFIRYQPIEILHITRPFSLIVADSGIPSLTKDAVGKVRMQREAHLAQYEAWFDEIADISIKARQILLEGSPDLLGPLMITNHEILQKIGVSTPELDRLIESSLLAGAQGAKLSGAGCGGNIIAIAPSDKIEAVTQALLKAGAVRCVVSHLKPLQDPRKE